MPQDHGLGAGERRRALSASRSQLEPGKTTTPMRAVTRPPLPRRRAAAPSVLDLERLDQRVRQQLAGQPLHDRPRRRLVRGVDRELDPPPDADADDALDAEVRQAALDGPALRVEDARLGRHVDGEPEARSGWLIGR